MLAWMWMVVVAWGVSVDDVPNPRVHGGWVTDMAGLLDDAAEARMNARIDALHSDLNVEIAVVTVQDADASSPKAFATELFNTWRIGDAEANNGLLVLLVMGERRLEMETGVGLEGVLQDGWLGSMQARHMVPLFKKGDFGAGMEAGIEAVDAQLRRKPDEAMEGTRGKVSAQLARDEGGGAPMPWWMGLGLGLGAAGGVAGAGFGAYRFRRRNHCPTCDIAMVEVNEVDDDAFLSSHERLEEEIGSVNYVVHQCADCGHHTIKQKVRWFSGFARCPKCTHVTLKKTSKTLRYATEYRQGKIEHHDACTACGYERTYVKYTARIVSSSSSGGGGGGFSGGGGGGGSFGGGSSGGGGAGSSF